MITFCFDGIAQVLHLNIAKLIVSALKYGILNCNWDYEQTYTISVLQ